MAKTAGTIPSLTSSSTSRQREDSPPSTDFEILCDDGRSIECSRQTLLAHWPWFRTLRPGQRSDFPPHPTTLPDHRRGKLLHHDTLQLPEPFPIALALVQYFETLKLETHLQRQPLVLTGMLEVAKVYDLAHLEKLCVNALHARLNATTAGGIGDIARELGCVELAASAEMILATIHTDPQVPSGPSQSSLLPADQRSDGLRRAVARPRSRSQGPDQRKSRPLSSADDVARSPTITVWSPPDVPVPPLLLTIPASPNTPSFAQRSRAGSNRSRDAPSSPSTRTPRRTSSSYDIPILPPPPEPSPPSTPVTPRMMPPRPAHADLSGGLFELALVDNQPAKSPEFQVGDIVPPPPPPPPSTTSRPPSRRSGSLPPLSWSASSATTSGDDESLKSPTSLASKLPWMKHNFPHPPSHPPSASPPAIDDPVTSAFGPTARKLQRRHPLLRRPHSIDTIISVMSTAGDDDADQDDHKNHSNDDDFGGSDRGHQHRRPSPRSPGSTFKEDSSTSTHDSGATHGAKTSFVSLGGMSRTGLSGPALPNSKEAKKLDKVYKELMKAQERFESARALAQQKTLLAEQKAKVREAEEKRKAQDKVLLKLIEEKRARVLAEDRRKRRWVGDGGGFGGGGVGVVGGFFG